MLCQPTLTILQIHLIHYPDHVCLAPWWLNFPSLSRKIKRLLSLLPNQKTGIHWRMVAQNNTSTWICLPYFFLEQQVDMYSRSWCSFNGDLPWHKENIMTLSKSKSISQNSRWCFLLSANPKRFLVIEPQYQPKTPTGLMTLPHPCATTGESVHYRFMISNLQFT